jgi:hypothetical protein
MPPTTTAPSSKKAPRRDTAPVQAVQDPSAEPVVTLAKLVERLSTYLESDAITEVERA